MPCSTLIYSNLNSSSITFHIYLTSANIIMYTAASRRRVFAVPISYPAKAWTGMSTIGEEMVMPQSAIGVARIYDWRIWVQVSRLPMLMRLKLVLSAYCSCTVVLLFFISSLLKNF